MRKCVCNNPDIISVRHVRFCISCGVGSFTEKGLKRTYIKHYIDEDQFVKVILGKVSKEEIIENGKVRSI